MPTTGVLRARTLVCGALAVLAGACVAPRRVVTPAPAPQPAYDAPNDPGLAMPLPETVYGENGFEPTVSDPAGDLAPAPAVPDGSGVWPVAAGFPGADSSAGESPAVGSVVAEAAEPAAPAWDLEVESNASRARVTYFVDAFSGRLHDAFERALSRQTEYAGMIEARLAAAGLPRDLTYLAFIESFFDPDAYSKAAAVGMWQFMAGTARGVGLRVDWWVDERRDPVRSTEGAVRLLSSLHDEFGSHFLAAAAYNGGEGRVSRGLAQFAARLEGAEGEDRYFALSDTRYLRPETRDYVPKLIAAALVAKQPDRYTLRVDSLAPLEFDSVFVAGGTPLAAVAAAAAAPVDSIRLLNRHILRGVVPPGDSMWVRVPVARAVDFDARFAALDPADLVPWTTVKSKAGESMVSIARRHKLTSKQLGWYNPKVARLKNGNLVSGQAIVVPTPAVVAAARDVPNPSIERYPKRARSTKPVRPAPPKSPAGAAATPSPKPSATSAAKSSAAAPRKGP